MRRKIVAGNWKMNMELNDGLTLAKEINSHFVANPLNGRRVIL